MKQRFIRSIQPNSMRWHIRRFLYKVHRRLDIYFNQEDTLLLNQMERLTSPRWKFGDYSYGHRSRSPNVVAFNEEVNLEIGKFCCFAENVNIIVGYGYHRVDWVTTYPFSVLFDNVAQPAGVPYAKGDVIIGNDVWVCTGSTIMSGVTIGNGAVVAACSVVTKDVPAYTVVAGNPARVISQRFSDEIITRLNAIRWWDWPIDKIRAECPILLSGDVETFVARHSGEFRPEIEHNRVGTVK